VPRLLHSKFTGQGAQPTYLSSKAKWSTEAPAQLRSAEHAEESIVTVSGVIRHGPALEVVPTKQIHSDLGVSPVGQLIRPKSAAARQKHRVVNPPRVARRRPSIPAQQNRKNVTDHTIGFLISGRYLNPVENLLKKMSCQRSTMVPLIWVQANL
jgi:hypothetical protein